MGVLTYHLNQGVLTGTASGRQFQLAAHRDNSRISAWLNWAAREREKSIVSEVSAGGINHKLKIGDSNSLEVYDYPGTEARRSDPRGSPPRNHSHIGPMVFIKDSTGGFCIHGYPPCNIRRCIVLGQGWDELWKQLARDKDVSLYIEY